MSSDLTRQEKFTFIAAATLISRAAVRGGMPYEEACSLSDIYCQQMDSMKRVQDINALTYQMAFEFCEKAHSSQGTHIEAAEIVRLFCVPSHSGESASDTAHTPAAVALVPSRRAKAKAPAALISIARR